LLKWSINAKLYFLANALVFVKTYLLVKTYRKSRRIESKTKNTKNRTTNNNTDIKKPAQWQVFLRK